MSWSKSIPMFTQLHVDNQIEVIRESRMEVNTLKLLRRIVKFPIATGNDIAFKTDHLAHLYLTDNPVVVFSIQKLTKECTAKMKDAHLDETEPSCLKLIALMNPFICNLSTSGQKAAKQAQGAGLDLLEAHVKFKSGSTQRKDTLLLYLGQVKALFKDTAMLFDDKQTLGSKKDDALLKLISQSLC